MCACCCCCCRWHRSYLPTHSFETDIENDPTEENDLSSTEPQIVQKLYAALQRFNASQIDQSTAKDRNAKGEPCGDGLSCAVPWLPTPATITCPGAPPPIKPQPPGPPPAPSPPGPSPPSKLRSHLTQAANWKITASSIALHGWACYDSEKQAPTITLTVDGQDAQHVLASGTSHGVCSGSATFGTFSAVLTAGKGVSFLTGEHLVNGEVVLEGGAREPLGDAPACIANGQPATCPDATTATTINPAHGGRDTAAAAAAEQPRVVSLQ
jgi:hypothetical protein